MGSIVTSVLSPISKAGSPCTPIPCLHLHPNYAPPSKMPLHAVPLPHLWLTPSTPPSLTHTAAEPPTHPLQDLPTPCWQGLASSKVTVFLHCLKQPGTTHGLKTEVTHAHESKTQSSFSVPFSATTRHLPSCHPIS